MRMECSFRKLCKDQTRHCYLPIACKESVTVPRIVPVTFWLKLAQLRQNNSNNTPKHLFATPFMQVLLGSRSGRAERRKLLGPKNTPRGNTPVLMPHPPEIAVIRLRLIGS